ncbi:MAG: hypothetical protein QG599_2574 [Pseudomonadota bacterium]|nr:hypothetical protein [Pseudomonadota bacterium]
MSAEYDYSPASRLYRQPGPVVVDQWRFIGRALLLPVLWATPQPGPLRKPTRPLPTHSGA